MTYIKTINPKFETIGRKQRLVGQLAELHDGEMLLHSMIYDTPTEAEQALDRIVWDILQDLHERGLVDDVAAACEAEGVTSMQIPSWLLDAQAAHAEDDAIVCAICGSPAWCACATSAVDDVPAGDDCPDHGPYADDDCPKCRARQNLTINHMIVQACVALHTPCKLCGGDHLVQHCPEVYALLVDRPIVRPVVCVTCGGDGDCPDCGLAGPGGVDLYAAAFDADAPDLIAEAGILVNTLEEMQFDLCADWQNDGGFPPHVMKHHLHICRILTKAERRLQRREFAELGGADYSVISRAPFCAEPDNQCSVHNPCPAHAADAARYLAQQSLTTWRPAEILVEDLPF